MERKKYFIEERTEKLPYGINLDVRAAYAWDLIRSHPNIAGIEDGEDSAGRAKIILQSAEGLVDRSFAIVDHFFDRAEQRGEFKETVFSLEELARKSGELIAIRDDVQYNFVRESKKEKV